MEGKEWNPWDIHFPYIFNGSSSPSIPSYFNPNKWHLAKEKSNDLKNCTPNTEPRCLSFQFSKSSFHVFPSLTALPLKFTHQTKSELNRCKIYRFYADYLESVNIDQNKSIILMAIRVPTQMIIAINACGRFVVLIPHPHRVIPTVVKTWAYILILTNRLDNFWVACLKWILHISSSDLAITISCRFSVTVTAMIREIRRKWFWKEWKCQQSFVFELHLLLAIIFYWSYFFF